MVQHTCNSSTWELRQENCEFEASLGYVVRPFLKKEKNQPQRNDSSQKWKTISG
jgi:hypothetical protein